MPVDCNNLPLRPFIQAGVFHLLRDADAVRRVEQRREKEEMARLEEIDQEKQRISERLARLDAERSKLVEQLNELEIAERVLSRFGVGKSAAPIAQRRRGRPAQTSSPSAGGRRARAAAKPSELSMSDATLKAVEAHGEGISAGEILNYLSREFGLTVRPNHLGIALQRHRRAGRLESRDGNWFLPHAARNDLSQQAMTE
jgi:hypothetical protein